MKKLSLIYMVSIGAPFAIPWMHKLVYENMILAYPNMYTFAAHFSAAALSVFSAVVGGWLIMDHKIAEKMRK